MIPVALTIAGSDPSGGAGVQADLKTFHQHGVYGTSAITLITVQTTISVSRVEVLAPDLVAEQVHAVLGDIPPHAIKTGALGSASVVEVVAELLARAGVPVIVDPVMISKHGAPLLDDAARSAVQKLLLPVASLLTPNAHEASALSGIEVRDVCSARDAARALRDLGPRAVLVKGGHLDGDPIDVLIDADGIVELGAERIETRHTHGTGCTLSAAITARIARGEALRAAVENAKEWLTRAIASAPGLGRGSGPVDHFMPLPRGVAPTGPGRSGAKRP